MVGCTAFLQSLLLLYCGALIASSSSGTEVNLKCSRDVPISLDLALLPRAYIIALSGGNDDPTNPVRNFANGNSGWCANISEDDNYVNMTFTEPVLLEGIRSFGRGIQDNFVSNFSILYTLFPESSEPLQLYNRHFTAMSSLQYYIREAITARRLQFRINEYGSVDTLFCWGLFLLGCTLDNTDVIPTSACPTASALIPNTTLQLIPASSACPTISAAVTSSIACITSSCPANINMTSLVTITSTVTVVQSSCELAQFTSTTSISAIGGVAGLVLLVGVVMIVSAMILCIITLVNKRKRLSVDVINLEERRPTIIQLENHALYEREREGSMINNQLYKSFDEGHHTSTLYETVEETNDGSVT